MDDSEIKSHITGKWDVYADQYDLHVSHGVQTGGEKQLWMDVFRDILPAGSLKILDVGCGTGAMGLILSEMGHTVVGIDLSENMMEIGRRKADDRRLSMVFLKGDAEDPPVEDGIFDVVINRHLLWTLPHPDAALQSWKRVIRPGGKVIVIDGVWDDGRAATKWRRALSRFLGKIFDPLPTPSDYSGEVSAALPHIGGVSDAAARKYFSEAGLTAISLRDLIHIRQYQRRYLKWYQKINHHWSYYLISGTKEA